MKRLGFISSVVGVGIAVSAAACSENVFVSGSGSGRLRSLDCRTLPDPVICERDAAEIPTERRAQVVGLLASVSELATESESALAGLAVQCRQVAEATNEPLAPRRSEDPLDQQARVACEAAARGLARVRTGHTMTVTKTSCTPDREPLACSGAPPGADTCSYLTEISPTAGTPALPEATKDVVVKTAGWIFRWKEKLQRMSALTAAITANIDAAHVVDDDCASAIGALAQTSADRIPTVTTLTASLSDALPPAN